MDTLNKEFFSDRYTVSEEKLKELSSLREEVIFSNLRMIDLKCKVCGFRVARVYSDAKGHIEIKCRKCKIQYPVNLGE